MYFSVVLVEDLTNLCIPAAWVYLLDVVQAFRSGVNRNLKRRIFFSKDLNSFPNFVLPLWAEFAPNEDGCYLAKIKNVFWTLDEAIEYGKKVRGGLPAVYSEMRMERSLTFMNGEVQIAAEMSQHIPDNEIKAEYGNQIALLRDTITELNLMLPPIDLTRCESNDNLHHERGDGEIHTDPANNNYPPYETVNSIELFNFTEELSSCIPPIFQHGAAIALNSMSNEEVTNSWPIESRASANHTSIQIRADGAGTSAEAIANTWPIRSPAPTTSSSQHDLQLQLKREIIADYVPPTRQSVIIFNRQYPVIDLTKDEDEEMVESPTHLQQTEGMENESSIIVEPAEAGLQQQPLDGFSGLLAYETSSVSTFFRCFMCMFTIVRFFFYSQAKTDSTQSMV